MNPAPWAADTVVFTMSPAPWGADTVVFATIPAPWDANTVVFTMNPAPWDANTVVLTMICYGLGRTPRTFTTRTDESQNTSAAFSTRTTSTRTAQPMKFQKRRCCCYARDLRARDLQRLFRVVRYVRSW